MLGSSRFQAVLQYYSGFTKLANPAIRNLVSTYTRQKSIIKDFLPLLHCFYEAQEPSLCKLVAPQFTRQIVLGSTLNPVDYLAIGYFITSLLSVPSSDTSNILLKFRNIDKHRLKLLLLELSKYPIGEALNERRLEITVQDKDINSYSHQLFIGLQHNSALVHLNLSNTGLVATEDTAQALTTMLQVNKTLTHLDLSHNEKLLLRLRSLLCLSMSSAQYHTSSLKPCQYRTCSYRGYCSGTHENASSQQILAYLDLSRNQKFSVSGAYFVFQGLQHNTSLMHLNLRFTGLVATKDTAQALTKMLQVNKTLAYLDLSRNHKFLVSGAYFVFQVLQHNTSLVHLNLSNTLLVATEDTAQALTAMLQVNKTLVHLDLSGNWYIGACVFQGLQHNTSLVHLNLSNTLLVATKDTAQALTKMLQVNKTLAHLDLTGNWKFSELGTHFVFQSLQHNTSLVHLNLCNTGLVATEDTAQALTTMLQVNKTLTYLDLSHNEKFSDSGAYCVFQDLQHNTSLVHLNLSNTGLVATKDTAQALTTMLQVNKTLTHLDLSQNEKFSDSGAYCVFQGLQCNTSLVHLNLSNTGLVATKDTAQALTTMFQVNKTLTHLDLSANCKFLAGANYFFESLQYNTTLVHLNLSYTGLVATEDTAQALTAMLQVNKTIKHLDLSVNCTFSDLGAYCVCQGLKHNTTLVYLNLSCTGITDKGAEYIAQALESNCSLQTLDISKNRITDNGFDCIDKSLETNTTLRLIR